MKCTWPVTEPSAWVTPMAKLAFPPIAPAIQPPPVTPSDEPAQAGAATVAASAAQIANLIWRPLMENCRGSVRPSASDVKATAAGRPFSFFGGTVAARSPRRQTGGQGDNPPQTLSFGPIEVHGFSASH